MLKMLKAIMNAVMLISIDDDTELNQLIQYIVTEFLSDDLKIDLYGNDVTTSNKQDFISSKRSLPDNQVAQKNIGYWNTESKVLHNWGKRELDHEEEKLNVFNKLLEAMKEHNRIQKERNNILKSFIEICEIAPFVDEKTEICISMSD